MDESGTRRVTVEEAAQLLGIEKESVKKRIQRGKLRSERDASGQVWVYLDRSKTVRDQSQRRSETDRDELVGELRDRVRSLERRLDEERESRRRGDTIIAHGKAHELKRIAGAAVPECHCLSAQVPVADRAQSAIHGRGDASELQSLIANSEW